VAFRTENVIGFDSVTNLVSVGGHDRADLPATCSSGHANPIQIGACDGERCAPSAVRSQSPVKNSPTPDFIGAATRLK
jgi:hypothetical protein